ncbi:hypothetical protein K431DRAFT_234391 [Polychaeton citri CBS 116435]|uniref:Zn(2)-C6 fungal-type domain-containing protein n=1 Tax=Polychaeton citri CBS 116435 TaxID=1314669 RepID=A0A9P4PZZ6_9PEZI|nr:hypothetical protein K431DRAFT_234391 [Polychaeton citri CBS 116435]
MRSSSGCWTCKVRRKKCDGDNETPCKNCLSLCIPCRRGAKPEWMDGGRRQMEKAEELKREVRAKSHHRFLHRGTSVKPLGVCGKASPATFASPRAEESPRDIRTDASCPFQQTTPRDSNNGYQSSSENILLSFYSDTVFPFLLPFYQPSIAYEGGRAWVSDFTTTSPVFRRVALCQSSYFFAQALGATSAGWNLVMLQTREVFEMLRHAIETISRTSVRSNLRGAVRIFAGIMQMQRFEISLMTFENCRAHFDAAIGLFSEMLACVGEQNVKGSSKFAAIIDALGPSAVVLGTRLPNSEQNALRLSTSLLLFDDIIASTILREQPRLYDLHESLLGRGSESNTGPLEMGTIVGCPNGVLLDMGKIAALNAWKILCQQTGSLDVLELARHAANISNSLQARLSQLEVAEPSQCTSSMSDNFASTAGRAQSSAIAKIWAHAALIHLLVVASGWQPANADVRFHVHQVTELLHQVSPASSLRALTWPFFIAGCLADDAHRAQIVDLTERLQPRSLYGTVMKALEVMESVRNNLNVQENWPRDLCSILGGQQDLILLV